MKKAQRLVTWILILTLCLSLAGPVAAAGSNEEDQNTVTSGVWKFQILNNQAILIGCSDDATGELTIPTKVNGYPVTTISRAGKFGGPWTDRKLTGITKITVPDSVKIIGQEAFFWCSAANIELGNGVEYIGIQAFYGCRFETIKLPNSLIELDRECFQDCDNLKELVIPENVSYISGGLAGGSAKLTKITVSTNNKYYTSVNGVIFSRDRKQLVSFPGVIDEYNVPSGTEEIMPDAGWDVGLKKITLPNTLKNIWGGAFDSCRLKTITIPGSVKRIFLAAFRSNHNLEQVVLQEGVNIIGDIGSPFSNCENLSSLFVPSSVSAIDETVFYGFISDSVNLDIYYAGNQTQWQNLVTASGADTSQLYEHIRVHYNSKISDMPVITDDSTTTKPTNNDTVKVVQLSKKTKELTEKDMFVHPYCDYLTNLTLNKVFETFLSDIDKTTKMDCSHGWRDYFALLKSNLMKPGEMISLFYIGATMSDSLNNSVNDKLAIALANKVQDDEDLLTKIMGKTFKSVNKSSGEMKKIYGLINGILNTTEGKEKAAELISELFNADIDFKTKQRIFKIIEFLTRKDTQKKLSDDAKKQGLSVSIDMAELVIYMVSIMAISDTVVDELMAPLQPYNGIYKALKRLKYKIENTPEELLRYAVYEQHLGEKWVKGALGKLEPASIKLAFTAVHIIGFLIPSPKFDDVVVASWASEAAKQYYAALEYKRQQYFDEKNGDASARQKEYSFLYIATSQMIDLAYDYALKIANKEETKTLKKDYKAIKSYLSYDKYIKECLKNANRQYKYILNNGSAVITGAAPNGLTTLGTIDEEPLQLMEVADTLEEIWMDIPEEIDGYPVIGIEDGAIPEDVTRVSLPDSMKMIGTEAFRNCSNLIAVYGGNNLAEISDEAFVDCENLEKISIAPSVTRIGDNAFINVSEDFTLEGRGNTVKQYAQNKGLKLLDTGKKATAISIVSMPKKTVFEDEQKVDYTGLSVKVTYDDGSSEILSNGIVCTLPSPKVGENTVYVFSKGQSATFKIKLQNVLNSTFSDIPEESWYTDAVYYCKEKGYMAGISADRFNPTGTVTRGTITQVLYAMEGKPKVSKAAGFKDVTSGKWYADSVNWAASIGIVAGYSKDKFGPNDPITRQQMVAIMYQFSKYKKYDVSDSSDISTYKDASSVAKYAVTPVKWAVAKGIISGTDRGLEPKGTATRAQIAVILRAYDSAFQHY